MKKLMYIFLILPLIMSGCKGKKETERGGMPTPEKMCIRDSCISSPVTIAVSMMSIPFPLGAVRAAVIICRATFNTCLLYTSRAES